ncbi:MAG: hypothetical protein GWP91_25290, partial [Rhodobacterales bacterium]|nr:hypothetical protein [Rhodobacterales bacterium]
LWVGSIQGTLALIFVTIGTAARPHRPITRWLHVAVTLVMGAVCVSIASGVYLFLGGSVAAVAPLTLASLVGVACMGLLAARQSTDRPTQNRLAATRVLAMCLAILTVAMLSTALGQGTLAAALNPMMDAAPLAERVSRSTQATAAAPLATTILAIALFIGGLSGLSTAKAVMGSFRGVASGVAALLVLALVPASLFAAFSSLAPLRDLARGGAISGLSMGLFHKLPQSEDFTGTRIDSDEILGSCLVTEAPSGWRAQPLYNTHERDIEASCPEAPSAFDGPFAFSEVPIIAMDASRAAAAFTGEDWFHERGALRLLTQPDPLRVLPTDAAARLQANTVSFVWEQPPALAPIKEPTPGVWNEAIAKQLPVTLMEGPYPVLIAGGLHLRLAAGELGRDTLRLALTMRDPSDRSLVLVPRKNWTVQDLVGFCTAIREVPSAQCVIRPENPIYWTIRTGLPLPW